MNRQAIRIMLIEEMVDVGELIHRGDEIYEDMGGHLVHERNLDDYIDSFLRNLDPVTRQELIDRTKDAD